MFGLLFGHNTFNRRWYGSAILKGGRGLRAWLNIATIAALAAVMLTLLATSIIISHSLFSTLPVVSSSGARQLHAQAAYGALMIVAVHVGMRWSMIMTSACFCLRLGGSNAGLTLDPAFCSSFHRCLWHPKLDGHWNRLASFS